MGDQVLAAHNKSKNWIISYLSTTVGPNVSKYLQQLLTGYERDFTDRVITKLYAPGVDDDIAKTVYCL